MSRKAQNPLQVESAAQFDSYDLSIISALAEDATISSKELSSRIHLSRTATARRVQNLLDKGLIETPRAKVDYKKLGFAIETTIQMSAVKKSDSFSLLRSVMERPEVLSVTVAIGRVVFFVDAVFRDTRHMHRFLSWAETKTDSETHLVLDVHRSTLPIRERIRAVDEFLASKDEFLDMA